MKNSLETDVEFANKVYQLAWKAYTNACYEYHCGRLAHPAVKDALTVVQITREAANKAKQAADREATP